MKKIKYTMFTLLSIVLLTACNTTDEQGLENVGTDMNNDRYQDVTYGGNAGERFNNNGNNILNRFDVEGEVRKYLNPNNGRNQYERMERYNAGGDTDSESQYNLKPSQDNYGDNKGTNQQKQQNQQSDQEASGFKQQVIELTNKEREKNGLPKLKDDSELADVAQKKSKDMVNNNYFSHNSPTYGSPFEMMQNFGIDYKTAAENIAAGQDSPEEVVRKWMKSAGHRKNILNKSVTHIGIGVERGGEMGIYWTQMFIQK